MFEISTRSVFLRLTMLLVGVILYGTAVAQSVADRVSVVDPYIRAVPPVVKTSAAFMQLRYEGPDEQFLVAASTPIAGAVELHTHEHDQGVMRMRRIPQIPLPPAKTVSLEPGGLHIMLFDLKNALEPGQEIPMTLVFGDNSTKEVTATVRNVQQRMKH